jgi:hypothetical protein
VYPLLVAIALLCCSTFFEMVTAFQILRISPPAKTTMGPTKSIYVASSTRSLYDNGLVMLRMSSSDNSNDQENEIVVDAEIVIEEEKEKEQKAQAVGNLLANDEWEGLTMELTEVIKTAVIEDMKANAREFLGKDDYKLGDISKEIDSRVKSEVANLRGKEVSFLRTLCFCWFWEEKNIQYSCRTHIAQYAVKKKTRTIQYNSI